MTAQTKLDFMKPEKKKHQMQYNYSSLPVEMQFLKAIKWVQNRLRLYLHIQSTKSNLVFKTMISTYFSDKRRISEPKTQ